MFGRVVTHELVVQLLVGGALAYPQQRFLHLCLRLLFPASITATTVVGAAAGAAPFQTSPELLLVFGQ